MRVAVLCRAAKDVCKFLRTEAAAPATLHPNSPDAFFECAKSEKPGRFVGQTVRTVACSLIECLGRNVVDRR